MPDGPEKDEPMKKLAEAEAESESEAEAEAESESEADAERKAAECRGSEDVGVRA